jgi:L-lactate dehydrogenase complex protein LldF
MLFKTFAWLIRRPALYRWSAVLGRLAQRPFARDGAIRSLPFFFGHWTRTRDLPVVASRTFSERWRELEREAGTRP